MFSIPQSEECLIGGILIDPNILKQLRAELQPTEFKNKQHRAFYQACLNVTDNGDPILPTSIVDNLSSHKKTARKEVSEYLAEILANVHTSVGWRYHVRQIKNSNLEVELLSISNDIAEGIHNESGLSLLTTMKERISSIKTGEVGQDIVELSDALPDVVASLEKRDNSGVTTGLYSLDALIGGWQAGDLIILAGRPGMGKSVLAKDFSEACKVPVLFFSLEMPRDQLIRRQLAAHSNINYTSIRRSRIPKNDWPKVMEASKVLDKMPIAYNDNVNMSIDELIATCENRKRKEDIGMVVIDYLQLIRTTGNPQHREIEVAGISRKLKGLARSLNIPVVCLAQLNRSCEVRGGDRKPILSDLRESGAIEQDADTVIFIWREVMYKKSAPEHEALLIVAKGRNTGTGKAMVHFDGSRQVFKNATLAQAEIPF